MPFDSTTLSLKDSLALAGVTPVPADVLAAHKAAQLKKYPGSWAGRHQKAIAAVLPFVFILGFFVGAIGAVFAFIGLLAGDAPWLVAAFAGAGAFGFGVMMPVPHWLAFGGVHVTLPARWEQCRLYSPAACPAPIAEIARQAQNVKGTHLIFGELKQDTVLLDPYLLLVRDGETVCLGVWDGDEILHIATVNS